MPMTAAQEERVRERLSKDEAGLLARVERGTSLRTLAQLYRIYEGENGVQEAVDAIRAKLNGDAPVPALPPVTPPRAPARRVDDDEDDTDQGVPIKRVPAGTITGAGRDAEAPPSRPAPTSPPSTPPPASPAPLGRGLQGVLADAAERDTRDTRVLAMLEERARSCMSIAHELDVDKGTANKSLRRLEREGKACRTDHEAFDYPRPDPKAGRRKSKVWMAIGGPVFEGETETEPAPAPSRNGASANGNGRPHAPAAQAVSRAPDGWRAHDVWASWTPQQRREMAAVVFGRGFERMAFDD